MFLFFGIFQPRFSTTTRRLLLNGDNPDFVFCVRTHLCFPFFFSRVEMADTTRLINCDLYFLPLRCIFSFSRNGSRIYQTVRCRRYASSPSPSDWLHKISRSMTYSVWPTRAKVLDKIFSVVFFKNRKFYSKISTLVFIKNRKFSIKYEKKA